MRTEAAIIKFVVIDDHPLVRQSMETALNETFPDSIVKAYSSWKSPSVVLMVRM